MSSKSLFTSFALAVVLLFGAFTSSFGQNSDICTPDCDFTPFGATQTVVLTLPGGCVVKVKYAIRHACNFWNDLGIISIEPVTPQCASLPIKPLLDITTIEMLMQNPMNFPSPGPDSCTTQWRVVNGACWTNSVTCDGDTIAVACDTVGCCLSGYRICADSMGNIVEVGKISGGITRDCDTTDPHCVPVCDEFSSFTAPNTEPGLSGVRIEDLHNHSAISSRRDPEELPAQAGRGTTATMSAVVEKNGLVRVRE